MGEAADSAGGLEVLGLVPARGGSKGLPRKNLLDVGGLPLVARAVQSGLTAVTVSRTVVSTDDQEIAALARGAGAEVPFLRPAELATDAAPSMAMVVHALERLEQYEGYRPELLVLLQPTTPFRTGRHIDEAVQLCIARDAESVVSVTPARDHPFDAVRIDDHGRVSRFLDIDIAKFHQRQLMPPAWVPNGAVYVARASFLRTSTTFFGAQTYGFCMDRRSSLDIDDEYDLEVARLLAAAGEH